MELTSKEKFDVIMWNSFFRKRYHVFETCLNRGMSGKFAYDNVKKMPSKEIKEFMKENY